MKSKHMAENGLLVALTLAVLYATSILPISTLSVLTIASCLIPICIMRTTIKNAFLVYIASSLLSLFIIPINISISYIFFFGIYGIIKYYIEKIHKLPYEILLKLVIFNILLLIAYFIISNFIGNIMLSSPLHLMFIFAQIVFLFYDYALTLIISIYLNKIHKHL
ncbi:MAG: hypothetical protein E7208_03945 [Clostridium butyricum]|nr:hypothetical protein [Clostridium butyricum]